MNKFSPYIREHIGFYLWQLNMAEVNMHYRNNFRAYYGWFDYGFRILRKIKGYYKNYNWRILTKQDVNRISSKINVRNAYGYTVNDDSDIDEYERIFREWPNLPKRYYYSLSPSDLEL